MHRVLLAMTALLICTQAPRVAAQDEPSKSEGGLVRVDPRLWVGPYDIARALRFWIQAASINYNEKSGHLTAHGNVKVDFQKYVLAADKLIYDRDANTLVAEGNVELKDPDDRITRAERLEASQDVRDAFVKSLARFL